MSAPTQRHIVVVDTETTGFNPACHACVEVAWWNLNTGERGGFIPRHDVSRALAGASIKALQINRYIDRIAGRLSEQDHDGVAMRRLAVALDGNTLAGSNPQFDAGFLAPLLRAYKASSDCYAPEWHHRLWDLAPYAAGVLGLDHLPGLAEVCDLLGVEAKPDHSAETDVETTGQCFLTLFDRVGVRLYAEGGVE